MKTPLATIIFSVLLSISSLTQAADNKGITEAQTADLNTIKAASEEFYHESLTHYIVCGLTAKKAEFKMESEAKEQIEKLIEKKGDTAKALARLLLAHVKNDKNKRKVRSWSIGRLSLIAKYDDEVMKLHKAQLAIIKDTENDNARAIAERELNRLNK